MGSRPRSRSPVASPTTAAGELPVAAGVAVFKSLSDAADAARAQGDPRAGTR